MGDFFWGCLGVMQGPGGGRDEESDAVSLVAGRSVWGGARAGGRGRGWGCFFNRALASFARAGGVVWRGG